MTVDGQPRGRDPGSSADPTIDVPPGEPALGPFRVVPTAAFAVQLGERLPGTGARPAVVAVDGRSGSGKSSIARAVGANLAGAVVVGTDDLAWHHSMFDWADLLVEHVLRPVHAGLDVEFRPPAWRARHRPGAIVVPATTRVLIVEGVGAARREAAPLLDVVVWVQSDVGDAERRGLARDGGDAAAVAFWHEWMSAELPFLAEQRPWERADVVVANHSGLVTDPTQALAVSAWRCPGGGRRSLGEAGRLPPRGAGASTGLP